MECVTPVMNPSPGDRSVRFVGDYIRFTMRVSPAGKAPAGWRALLRTNIGRAELLREEIIRAHTAGLPMAGASWRDLPMDRDNESWFLELPLAEAGYFKAKAYLVDERGWQHWPDGNDVGISVHPNAYRTGNTIYCAFTRLFEPNRNAATATPKQQRESIIRSLDDVGYHVIPSSGTLRDLKNQLPHILETLGCRILHLLPINPTPTTYARFGRFGSPYAALDLTAIDPALVVFDKRTTGEDQFRELTYETHRRGGRVFLDIVINHTGWGSVLQEQHPEWFLRTPDGTFVSPGAWGTTWEDLVELNHQNVVLWDKLAQMFVTWCQRGVDGFRCDAGYKVPVKAWQYIVARVQQEYREAMFLLEGLGGAWELTEALLGEGGMQWAYSELFQNYSGREISTYLDHSIRSSNQVGLLVHYSETHDNQRLAVSGKSWSLLRNRLCGLTSSSGGFGFTCGVEWLATEKINVHDKTDLCWGTQDNTLSELARLNRVLLGHPCFFERAELHRCSEIDSDSYVLLRISQEQKDLCLVLINTNRDKPASLTLDLEKVALKCPPVLIEEIRKSLELAEWYDLLGQNLPKATQTEAGAWEIQLEVGASFCLSPWQNPRGLAGEEYRLKRAQAAWGLQALFECSPSKDVPLLPWLTLAGLVESDAADVLGTSSRMGGQWAKVKHPADQFVKPPGQTYWQPVIIWELLDRNKVTMVPPGHWLLIKDIAPFRATLRMDGGKFSQNIESIRVAEGQVGYFRWETAGLATLQIERYAETNNHVRGRINFLASCPSSQKSVPQPTDIVLLTNGRGGMARLCVDLGRINSKYDCVLGANLHPTLPVDRHVLAKRIRIWVSADGFTSPLDFQNLQSLEAGPPATWEFVANAGDGRTVQIQLRAEMIEGQNTTVFHCSRPSAKEATGKQLSAEADVRLTVRLDIEDRSFHSQTKYNGGADHHFSSHLTSISEDDLAGLKKVGFEFAPTSDRQLRAYSTAGIYHPQPEWSYNIAHPVEHSRGQEGSGDAFSPGWFEIPLAKGARVSLVLTAETKDPALPGNANAAPEIQAALPLKTADPFGQRLIEAARAFVVKRGGGKTVIAGYPWFLDWGRDTFICARGLLAAGMVEEVKQIALIFARFEKEGTLPNTIFGEDASNRDTSDAPLWFGMVCEELARILGKDFYREKVGHENRTIADTLRDIGLYYVRGTPNRIKMDEGSGLIWSPSHFTWMDTNYPAATPREGYPVEIQALWIRLLWQLEKIRVSDTEPAWGEVAAKALESVENRFWNERKGWYGDVILSSGQSPAKNGTLDTALRSNCLFLISLGLVQGDRARRMVKAAERYLVVPGALRTLAPLPVEVPLRIIGNDGRELNDALAPYWPHYEGDEDTRRKPAYHNGTAWTWTFPVFCEALAMAWDFSPESVASARAYLGSMEPLLNAGCLGQLPEILDGDAPHTQRGCDAQAWAATEALRVWKLINQRDFHT
jgi:starch synthase (maltosyl-transferring)